MKHSNHRSLVFMYIYLAASCFAVGIGLVLLTLTVCKSLNVNVFNNLWVLLLPVALTLIINVSLIELYRKITKK